MEETNRHSNTAIKVVGTPMKQLDIYLMDFPALNKEIMLSVEAEVGGHPHDAAAEK